MGFFWLIFVVVSVCLILTKNPELMLGALTDGAKKAVNFSLYMLPIYAVWMGVLELMDKSKLTDKIAKLLMPVIYFLFGYQDEDIRKYLATNIAANLIGVGGAATPSGIMAAQRMQGDSEIILKSTIMLIVLNSSSLQIVPTTIISMRAETGSAMPSSIFFPALITSIASTFFAIFVVKLFVRKRQGIN